VSNSNIIMMKRGDTLPVLERTLQYSSGTAINLTGATVRFKTRNRDTGAVVTNGLCTVVSATAGTVSYTWQSADTATAGEYDAEFEVTFPSGVLSVPNFGFLRLSVGEDVS